jgi:ADP-ribosylglycohydrolase
MMKKTDLLKNRPLLYNRACAALIGHAIGDSFGDAARTADCHFRFGITMDFPEGPAPGTDDTEFALLTAHTLIQAKGELTAAVVLENWRVHVLPLSELKRGGASEREAAANIRRGILPPLSGIYNSYSISDGAAMRVTPIGIACAGDPQRAAYLADIDARISHSRDGIWGAQAVASAIAVAMAGADIHEVIRTAIDTVPKESWLRFTLEKASAIVRSAKTLEEVWMPLHEALWSEYKAAVPEAVASAFGVLELTGGDFKKGIIYAGNFGRDADTIAAIVGAISGAMNGMEKIPPAWTDKVRFTAGVCLPFTKGMDLFNVASQLTDLIQ